jgi:Raf kinase inhibitor-like YbhB/YbcL family protein
MLEKLPPVLGHALRDRRAGLEKIVFNRSGLRTGMGLLHLSSLAFVDHGPIPARYTADGEGVSPPLDWTGVPPEADSLVLVVEDADAPTGEPLVHAIVVGLPAGDGNLHEGALDSPGHEGEEVQEGRNSYLRAGWLPPDPPPGHGQHRYVFQLFALGPGKPFSGKPGRDDVLEAIQERAIASGMIVGTYERPDGTIKIDAPAVVARTIPPA